MATKEKILHYKTFEELHTAMRGYAKLGISCACNTWECIGDNVLHIYEEDEWWNNWTLEETNE